MIIIKTVNIKPVNIGPGAAMGDLHVQVVGSPPDMALSEIFGAMESLSNAFIKQHPPGCDDCGAFTFAKNIQRHVQEIREEQKIDLASRKVE